MAEPAKLDHAKGVTTQEHLTLAVCLRSAGAGLIGDAGAVLATGLLAEHYESLLADDPQDRTEVEKEQLAELQRLAQEQRDRTTAALGESPGPRYP